MLNCGVSTTTAGVILGGTSTMPIELNAENAVGDGIGAILNSAMLNKQILAGGAGTETETTPGTVLHDHLRSASMLKGQFY